MKHVAGPVALLALAAPPAAPAATLDTEAATYVAAAGEENLVTYEQQGFGFRLRDDGARIAIAGSPTRPGVCRLVDDAAHEVVCRDLRLVRLHALDGDDRVDATGELDAAGGEGDDALIGGPGSQRFEDGPGRDVIRTGDDTDVVIANDVERASDDSFDGGGGYYDEILYAGDRGVRIDLAAGTAGTTGERDVVHDFEHAYGTFGSDVITGSEGPDELTGNGGDDVIDGRGGDDTIYTRGAAGDTRLAGGEGDDRLQGGDGDEVLDGGPGDDVMLGEAGRDALFGGDGADHLAGDRSGVQGGILQFSVIEAAPDLLDAGAGNDSVVSDDLTFDRVDCGNGSDIGTLDRRDRRVACEALDLRRATELLIDPPDAVQRVRRGRIALGAVCPEQCLAAAALRVGGRTVDEGTWACEDGAVAGRRCLGRMPELVLRLPRGVTRRVRRRGRVKAVLRITLDGDARIPVDYRVELRR